MWPEGTYVDFERGLNSCIRQVRVALSDDASSPRFLATIPRQGYKFVAPVTVKIAEPEAAADDQTVPPSAFDVLERESAAQTESLQKHEQHARPTHHWMLAAVLSSGLVVVLLLLILFRGETRQRTTTNERAVVAVLPFVNLSDDSTQEYLSDGITDELISRIGQANPDKIGVIARTSAMKFRNTDRSISEIAEALKADYILEGSLRRSGNNVRITASLIRASDQTKLWAAQFDDRVDPNRMLQMESEISARIANSLCVALTPKPLDIGTADPKAYDLYLRGRYQWRKRTKEGFETAIGYFQQALQRDPK